MVGPLVEGEGFGEGHVAAPKKLDLPCGGVKGRCDRLLTSYRILRVPRLQQRLILGLELGELLLARHPQAQRERPVVGGVVVGDDEVVGDEVFSCSRWFATTDHSLAMLYAMNQLV